jgi:hypothetical protein
MTPQLLQSIRLLQFHHVELLAFLQREAEGNPLLELVAPAEPAVPAPADRVPEPAAGDPSPLSGRQDDGAAFSDGMGLEGERHPDAAERLLDLAYAGPGGSATACRRSMRMLSARSRTSSAARTSAVLPNSGWPISTPPASSSPIRIFRPISCPCFAACRTRPNPPAFSPALSKSVSRSSSGGATGSTR